MLTTTQKGLGWAHQKERQRLLTLAEGQICWRCGRPMWPSRGQLLDLDHVRARALGGSGPRVMAHRRCNQAAGGRLGHELARQRRARVVAAAREVRRW